MSTDVSAALAEAKALVASLESHDGSTEGRLSLIQQAARVRSALETPYDIGTRWIKCMSAAGALNILLRIGALDKIPAEGSVTASHLAKETNADVSIITRAMRILVVNGIGVEAGLDEYASNALLEGFQPKAFGGFVHMCVDFMKTWGVIPDYIKTHEPSELYDIYKSPFAFMEGHEGKTYYDVINLDPYSRDIWNHTLQNMESNFPILDMFPFRSLREQFAGEHERACIVDVGGGRGQALRAIMKECGWKNAGKWILQDLPIVIDALEKEGLPDIDLMRYDIFTPQPVKNAHVYFMRRLLHDFYNPLCVTILRNTASAMGPDSRLLVCDMLVPDRVDVGRDLELYWLDFALLTIGGKEKKLDEFKKIFGEAGLELVEVYPSKFGRTAVLEGRLKRG